MGDTQGWTAPGHVPPDRDRPVPPGAGTVPPDATSPMPWGAAPVPPAPGPPTQPPYYGPPPSQQAPYAGPTPPPPPTYGGAQSSYGSPPAPRLEHRPGVVPLRPLALGEIWSGVFATVRGNPAATLGLALLTTTVTLVPTTLLALWVAGQDLDLGALLGSDPFDDPSMAGGSDPFLSATIASYVPLLTMWVTSILLPLFMALVIGHAIRGRKVTLGETWRESRSRILAGFGTTLFIIAMFMAVLVVAALVIALIWSGGSGGGGAGLATALTVLVAVPAVVFLWVKVGFAVPIVVLERAGAGRAIRRSWQLTRGRPFWRIFGIRLLTSIVASIAGSIVATPITFLLALAPLDDPQSAALTFAWVLPLSQAFAVLVQNVLVTPFVSGVDSLVYLDQRIRREGLDMQIMQQLHAPRSS